MASKTGNRILVTGFTGRLGGMVARVLYEQHNLTPRVLVRPHHLEVGSWVAPRNVEVAVADYDDPTSLGAALEGVDSVFLVSPVHPEMRNRELTLARQAARLATPPNIVKISGLGTKLDSPVDSGRWHAEIEQGIRALGLTATCLRPLFLMQNLTLQLPSVRENGALRGTISDAAIAMVDGNDVAEVAAAALVGDTPINGQDATLTGPRTYTYADVAAILSVVLGRPVASAAPDPGGVCGHTETARPTRLAHQRPGAVQRGVPPWLGCANQRRCRACVRPRAEIPGALFRDAVGRHRSAEVIISEAKCRS